MKSWVITFSIRDNKGKLGKFAIMVEWWVDAMAQASTWAEVEDIAEYLAPIIDALTGGQIIKISVNRNIPLPVGLKSAPSALSDVEQQGVFIFSTGVSNPRVVVPAFLEEKVISGSDLIDLTDGDVNAFWFLVTDGSGSPADYLGFCDNRDDEISSLKTAYERHRKS